MTNETENILKIRTVTTGAWWKNFKKKKVTKTARDNQPVKKAKPRAAEQTARSSPDRTKKSDQQETVQELGETLSQASPEKTRSEETGSDQQSSSREQVEPVDRTKEKNRQSRQPRKTEKKALISSQEAEIKEEVKETKDESRNSPQKSTSAKSGGKRQKKLQESKKVEEKPQQEQQKKQKVRLLINAEEPEECRIALVEDGRLESFHVSTVVRERTKNNIYKGRIVSIEANLQAAFVEIGTGRNGFLPFNDIHPEYYREDISEQSRKLINQQQWKKLKIEDVIKRGQEVLVQVVKEVTGNKGANMTTYLSLPGRCLVLMPGSDSAGISRKISGEKRRSELREIMSDFNIPEGVGYIVRTASAEITKTALQQDLGYLTGLWTEIKKRGQSAQAPALVYEDQDTVHRFLRDHFTQDIREIIVDTEESYSQVANFVKMLPGRRDKVQVRLHRGAKPIFNQSNIEEQIESIYQPQVQLPSGGSIVIDPTEALVAIDVNSGRTSQKGDFEKSIFLANMEAAEELARQLRLRDLGGLIVVDFIDMRSKGNIREVEKQVKNAMKRDKAKVDISRISRFGLLQISRQKMGAPIEKGSYRRCEHCEGRGVVRSVETLALYYLRRIQTGVARKKITRVEADLPLEVGQYLLNKKRTELIELESKHQAAIIILPSPEMKPSENNIRFLS